MGLQLVRIMVVIMGLEAMTWFVVLVLCLFDTVGVLMDVRMAMGVTVLVGVHRVPMAMRVGVNMGVAVIVHVPVAVSFGGMGHAHSRARGLTKHQDGVPGPGPQPCSPPAFDGSDAHSRGRGSTVARR